MSKLTQQEKRIRLAQSQGWLDIHRGSRRGRRCDDGRFLRGTKDPDSVNYPREYSRLPDYFGDIGAALGAVQASRETLIDLEKWSEFAVTLEDRLPHIVLGGSDGHLDYFELADMVAALNPADIAEALGQTLGLWKEGE